MGLSLEIRNTSWTEPAQVKLELQSPDQRFFVQECSIFSESDHVCSDFTFVGKSSFMDTIQPEESLQKVVYAVFSRPGTYNINRWKLHVTVGQSLEAHTFMQVPNTSRFISIVEG